MKAQPDLKLLSTFMTVVKCGSMAEASGPKSNGLSFRPRSHRSTARSLP